MSLSRADIDKSNDKRKSQNVITCENQEETSAVAEDMSREIEQEDEEKGDAVAISNTATTTGYLEESPPAEMMKNNVEKVVDHILQSLRYAKFAHELKGIKNPQALITAHKKMMEDFHEFIVSHVSNTIEEMQVISKLNDLWHLQTEAPSLTPAWRPSGDPDKDLVDVFASTNIKYNRIFKDMLTKEKLKNAEKMAEIQRLESDIVSLRDHMISISSSLKEIGKE